MNDQTVRLRARPRRCFGSGSALGAGPKPAESPSAHRQGSTYGDTFQFVFITDGSTQAFSTDIAYYNSLYKTPKQEEPRMMARRSRGT